MKRFFIHPGITPTTSFTDSYRELKTQDTGFVRGQGTQPNTSIRCWLKRQAKFYYENVVH